MFHAPLLVYCHAFVGVVTNESQMLQVTTPATAQGKLVLYLAFIL